MAFLILYFIIVRGVVHFETTAARGLKFWLQVALSAPIATAWTQIRKSGSGSGKSGFSGNFFFAFFASMDLLEPQGHPPGWTGITGSGSGPGNLVF